MISFLVNLWIAYNKIVMVLLIQLALETIRIQPRVLRNHKVFLKDETKTEEELMKYYIENITCISSEDKSRVPNIFEIKR